MNSSQALMKLWFCLLVSWPLDFLELIVARGGSQIYFQSRKNSAWGERAREGGPDAAEFLNELAARGRPDHATRRQRSVLGPWGQARSPRWRARAVHRTWGKTFLVQPRPRRPSQHSHSVAEVGSNFGLIFLEKYFWLTIYFLFVSSIELLIFSFILVKLSKFILYCITLYWSNKSKTCLYDVKRFLSNNVNRSFASGDNILK